MATQGLPLRFARRSVLDRSGAVPGRRTTTCTFAYDDTHQLTLPMLDGQRRATTEGP